MDFIFLIWTCRRQRPSAMATPAARPWAWASCDVQTRGAVRIARRDFPEPRAKKHLDLAPSAKSAADYPERARGSGHVDEQRPPSGTAGPSG